MVSLAQVETLAILVMATVLFWTGWVRPEMVAILVMVLLMVLGVVTPEEGVSGFSNSATLTVLALLVLSAGVHRTGVLREVGRRMANASRGREGIAVALLVLVAAPASAFLNNTAIVAMLIPVTLAIAAAGKLSPSKLLMPLSQASMLAGAVTLIGTSTNVLTSSLVAERLGQGFGMFEFSRVGLLIVGVGLLYILLIGRHLVPARIPSGTTGEQSLLQEFVTELRLRPDSSWVGRTANEAFKDGQTELLRVLRGPGGADKAATPDAPLQAGDVLVVRANRDRLSGLDKQLGSDILSGIAPEDLGTPGGNLVEVVLTPNSSLARRTITEGLIARQYGVRVLGLRSSRWGPWSRVFATHLTYGDTLLVLASDEALDRLRQDPQFIVGVEKPAERLNVAQASIALGVVAGVVGLSAIGVFPILVAALAGAVLMVLLRVLKPDDLWASVRWDVIFTMAGMIPLGVALERTGVADTIGSNLADVVGFLPDVGIVAAFYAVSMLLTAFMSNSGNVVVMVPIAFATAAALDIQAIPLVLAVMFASSNDFLTPIGYQTNLMIFGPGGYRFTDYARSGAGLALLMLVVTSFAIVEYFPLH